MMSPKRVLIIPDAYIEDYSGAYVAKIAKQLLVELSHTVAIFSTDVKEQTNEDDGTRLYPRLKFRTIAYWQEDSYLKNYCDVLDSFQPDIVFTLGSVTNKPVLYWRVARDRGIKIISKIFMQDFFCANYYANDSRGLCTRCLDHGFMNVFRGECHPFNGSGISNIMHELISVLVRNKLRDELIRADAVLTSSHQQVEFYVKYGIPRDRCYITPLYFNGEKLKHYTSKRGDYFVFVAQNRIEKGIHLLKDILANCKSDIRVIAAYTSQERIDEALSKYGLLPFVESGVLEMRPNCTWRTDLGDLLAGCRGVVNPSIWPTTTEYVLLEALGLKKPIFTFNVGIHSEVIDTGINGFVADSPGQMAEQMGRLLKDDTLYDIVSTNAYKLFERKTDWECWKTTLDNILQNCFN